MKRLIVWVDLSGRSDMWAVHKGKKLRFANAAEARHAAELRDYDGVRFKVARGYGLKPRVDTLLGKGSD